MATGSTFGETAWAECESVIRRFEDAWRDSGRPDIAEYLAADPLRSTKLLVELVHIDLEFRLRAGENARAEDYFTRFPELAEPELTLDLITAEFALRNRYAPPAWAEEFLLRFPEHLPILRVKLPVRGGTSGFSITRPAERPGAPLLGPPVIGGYEIEGELGRGGMGVVYKARDVLLNRTVAVKTFATVPRPDSCTRFAREAEAIARLDHPNIVPVYEVGEWHAPSGGPAVPYFAMKWYPGGSLDAIPAGPGTDVRAQARIVESIARAVHHAHQRGILHRDLKPSNILLDDAGRPHVADFGLAGRVDPDAATMTAVVAGTPAYMAPEQARTPKQVSTAADVYGLGAILYHQLTGHAPFAADSPLATLDLVAHAPVDRPSSINPAIPRDLDTICVKCLEKEPARRYASAAELADDLERWRKGLPITARPARAWELAYRRVRRHPFVTALILTTVAALVGTTVVLAVSNARIAQKEQEAREAYLRECAMRYQLEDSLRAEQAARGELVETSGREQRALYLERVTSAGRLYAANQLAEAWALLDACPERHRGWEWRYLDAQRRRVGAPLAGDTPGVTAVAYLPDGRLVSVNTMGGIRVWGAGQQGPREWKCGESPVFALSVHPTRNWIAVADRAAVTVWDADTGRRLERLTGSGWAAFSPDGNRLATADGSAIRLWSVPNGVPDTGPLPEWKSEEGLFGHRGRVQAGVFTPDGNILTTASLDGTVRRWGVARGEDLGTRTASTPVNGLALATGGTVLVEAHPGYVLFTNPTTGELRERLDHPTDERPTVAVSPDGREVAIGGANGAVVVWDVVSRWKRVYRGHPGRVTGFAFGPNRKLASCGGDVIRVWDLNSEQEVRTLARVGDGDGGLAVSPDGTLVAVGPRFAAQGLEVQVAVFDAHSGRVVRRVATGPAIEFHGPTGRLVSGRVGGGVVLWDRSTWTPVWSRPFPDTPDSVQTSVPGARPMALTRDGSVVAAWNKVAKGVQLWDANGTPTGLLPVGGYVFTLTFSPDGSRLVAATSEGVTVWDVTARTRIAWGEGRLWATVVAFSPDGRQIATVEKDHVVRLRDADTGKEVRHFVGTGLRVSALCFSPDGTRLVTGGADKTVRVWDVETGRELLALPGVTEGVTGVAWDARSNRVYALDHAVRIWGTN